MASLQGEITAINQKLEWVRSKFLHAGIEDDVPEFNLDELIEEAKSEFAPLVSESKEMAAQAQKEIQKLEKELQTLEHLQVCVSHMFTAS